MADYKVELKKVKIARYLSEETTAFSAQLWVDGEYIADVSNDGHGGNNRIMHRFDGKGLNTRDKVQAFEAWCDAQPRHQDEDGSLGMSADFYISLMVDDYEKEQQVKRWCKTKTVIRLKGDKPGVFHTYKRAYDPEFAQRIRNTEPNLVEILNERYLYPRPGEADDAITPEDISKALDMVMAIRPHAGGIGAAPWGKQ